MEYISHEQRMVAEAFQNGFSRFHTEPLVLYGIGNNTKAVLELTNGFTIAGLLDQNPENIGKIYYGKRVLSLDEAAAISRKIVIIARSAIVPVIYQRIKAFTEEHEIEIYNYAGKLLKEAEKTPDSSDLEYWNHSWEDLKEAVASHDVISFDIFDTLLGRYVLRPEDVFCLVEKELRDAGREVPFASLRMQAGRECGYAASLEDIYERLHQMGHSWEDCQDWRGREFNWEKKVVFPRRRVVEAFRFAKSLGKQVFLVSDMYLSAEKMETLLHNCGIEGYDGLLISCQERAEKSDGMLFAKLLDIVGDKSVLHIGDDRFGDGEAARHMGLDTWLLYSGYDLLMVSSIRSLLENISNELGDRLALGSLCAKLFEDPFALHRSKGKIVLAQPEQLGYCFFGPWALSFMQWAAERVRENSIEEFLFPSRDGFLLYRIGRIMQRYGYMQAVELKYFKASRRALSVASLHTREDLRTWLQRKGNYSAKGEMLADLFGVTPDPSDTEQTEHAADREDLFQYLLSYFTRIQAEADWERKNYQKYLRSKGLFNDRKTATFDSIAQGTVQYYLEQQLEKDLLGLYCARAISMINDGFKESHILSAFGEVTTYGSSSALVRAALAMEALLIDGDRQLLYFDESGKPIFQQDNGILYERALETQEYACAFAADYLARFGHQLISTYMAERLIDALFSSNCQIDPPASDAFIYDDITMVGQGGNQVLNAQSKLGF